MRNALIQYLSSHERHLTVGMGVDPTRHDHLSRGIDHFGALWRWDTLGHLSNFPEEKRDVSNFNLDSFLENGSVSLSIQTAILSHSPRHFVGENGNGNCFYIFTIQDE